MNKSIFTNEYRTFLRRLREAREASGLTQGEFAARLGQTQSFVSKCERGERRIDLLELRHFCKALGISFISFVQTMDEEFGAEE